jgi:hypothetical protein
MLTALTGIPVHYMNNIYKLFTAHKSHPLQQIQNTQNYNSPCRSARVQYLISHIIRSIKTGSIQKLCAGKDILA